MWMFISVPRACAVPGAGDVREGNEAYFKGQYKDAAEHYEAAAQKSSNDPRIDYDQGVAAYKNGKFNDAVGYFNKALLTDDLKLHDDAQFDLANSLYKLGVENEDQDVKGAIKNVEDSLLHYDKVLAADPGKDDAKSNRGYVASELERLKKKQLEPKPQNSRQDKKSKNDSKDPQDQQNQQGQSEKDSGSSKDKQQSTAGQKSDPKEQTEPSSDPADKKKDNDQSSSRTESDKKSEDQKAAEAKKASGGKDQQQDPGASAGQAGQGHILSQDEANMLLDDFSQNEQPKGLLNFVREPRQERPVTKDW